MARVFLLICLMLLGSAGRAAAEWHITPFAGLTMFGNTSIVDPGGGTAKRHLHAGGAVTWLSRGIVGIEAMTVWTPGFFEGTRPVANALARPLVESSRTVSVMGNIVVTLPQRWTEYGLRPFVSGGFGLLHAVAVGGIPVDVDVAGFNIGGGAIGFLSQRTGLRFEVRYHSTLNRGDEAPSFGPLHLRYVTASIGIVFRPGP